jgi:hypothetical protein
MSATWKMMCRNTDSVGLTQVPAFCRPFPNIEHHPVDLCCIGRQITMKLKNRSTQTPLHAQSRALVSLQRGGEWTHFACL